MIYFKSVLLNIFPPLPTFHEKRGKKEKEGEKKKRRKKKGKGKTEEKEETKSEQTNFICFSYGQ